MTTKTQREWCDKCGLVRDHVLVCRHCIATLTAERDTARAGRDTILEEAAKACTDLCAKMYDHAKGPYELCAKAVLALKSRKAGE